MEYTSSWSSYPSIFALGHRAIKDLLQGEVNVEEKVDGSQFSFGMLPMHTDDSGNAVDVEYDPVLRPGYALKIRSKGCVMHVSAPEKMFNQAAETVRRLADQLIPGWTYRGEYLAKPKHNSLVYDRVPAGNIIIFDINTGNQEYLSYEEKQRESERLGLEVVPRIFHGRVDSVEAVRGFLDRVSILGGQQIEGVVIKPTAYNLYGLDKKVLFGKFVSEAFKEVHRKAWGESNPTTKDVVGQIIAAYTSPARWNKAIQHLREAGKLVDDVQDIGPIIKEIPNDVLKECEEDIKDDLFKHFWPHIRRGLTTGFPLWYKELLLKRSFETDTELTPEQESTGDVDAESIYLGDDLPPDSSEA